MRKSLLLTLLALSLLSGCRTQPKPSFDKVASAETPETATESFPEWDDRSIFADGLIPAQQHYLEELTNAPIYHLDYEIDPGLISLRGYEEIRYTNQEETALEEIAFHLFPNILGGEMIIHDVKVNDQKTEVEYGIQNSYMLVPLTMSLQPGESVLISIDFTTIVPSELESNYGILASTEGVLALAHAYPMLSVYDDDGWNIALPSQQGDVTYGDASFYVVRVNAPKELVLVASGNETMRKVEGDRQATTFAIGPARDFYLAASADYVHTSTKLGNYTINSYAPAGMEDGAQLAMEVTAEALEIFGEAYAPYPYTEFDLVTTPTYALGIEYPGMTALNVNLYDLSANFSGTPASVYLESTTAHEVAHQWFYNLIGNDQLDDPWLDESLVQYITWQYYAMRYGESGDAGFRGALESRWDRVDHANIPVGQPVSAYEGDEYGAIVYGRGAFFFEALANTMGKDSFDAFLAEYTRNNEWKNTSPEDLRALAEKHCNCSLETLFDEWIY